MKKIVYKQPSDVENFDIERFINNLNKYGGTILHDDVEEALKNYEQYETMHVSLLVELGVDLLLKTSGEEVAKRYYDDHAEWLNSGQFERLRRITGYLVGTLSRWNDAKQAEEKARVKHSVNSAVDDKERETALETMAMERNIAYDRDIITA